MSGSTPGVPPLVAQSGRAPPQGGCRRFDSCPRSQDLDWKYRSKDHPPNAGRSPPRLRCNRQGFTPSAGDGLCQHPAQPAPAASRAAALPTGGSTHGALHSPGCAPWHPAIAVTATRHVTSDDNEEERKKERKKERGNRDADEDVPTHHREEERTRPAAAQSKLSTLSPSGPCN